MTEHNHGHHTTSQEAESRYASVDQVWSGEPNQALIAYLDNKPATGAALDIGCGEGADVAWLANKGWQATGIDFAPTAVRRAKELIDASPNSAEIVEVSFTEFAISSGQTFDLVCCSYGQIPANEISMVQLRSLVAPGGTLFIVHHDMDSEVSAMPRWIAENLGDLFEVTTLENYERDVQTGAGAHHKLDIVLIAQALA